MRKRKRANGEGSIYWSDAHQRFEASVTVRYDANGKRKRRTVTGKTKTIVVEKLLKLQAETLKGPASAPNRETVAAFLGRWLEIAVKPKLRDTTYLRYEGMVRSHINPLIGGVQLSHLAAPDVQAMLTSMESEGASARTRQIAVSG